MEILLDNDITQIVKAKFNEDILQAETVRDLLTLTVKADSVINIIEFLFQHSTLKFQFLTDLFAVHYPELNAISLVYQLHSLENNKRIRIKTYLPEQNPEIKTLTGVFSGANWMERETYDFFGVKFTGHPDLKRILNVDDMIIFPLRKEFPLEDQTREDKNDKMFGR